MECILSASIVQWSPIGAGQLASQRQVMHYSTSHEIFNCTGRSIGVARRDGTKFVIPPLSGRQNIPGYAQVKNSIIVMVKEVFADLPARCIANQQDPGAHPENKIFHHIRTQVKPQERGPGGLIGSKDWVVDTAMYFPIDQFPEDESAYCREIDYLFTVMPDHYHWAGEARAESERFIKHHPDSPQGVREWAQIEIDAHNEQLGQLLIDEGIPTQLAGSVFIQNMIFIEGDDSKYGKLYVRVKTDTGNKAVMLKPRKSATKLPGLYLVTNARKDNQVDGAAFTIEHLTTSEQFARHGVFTSRQKAEQLDAETVADMEYQQKVKAAEISVQRIEADNRKLSLQAEEADRKALAEREAHELKMTMLERDREKSQREHLQAMEQLQAKATVAEQEAKLWREKFESERKKEQHENTSNKRKSFIEGSKLIAVMLSVSFALIKLIRDIFIGAPIKA
jgi:hypothetical protein